MLDVFAGTGAVALEALSRGAAPRPASRAIAVPCTLIEENAALCGEQKRCAIIRDTVERALQRPVPGGPFDIIVLDPPYDYAALDDAVHARRRPARPGRHRGARARVAGDAAGTRGPRADADGEVRRQRVELLRMTSPAPRIAIYPGSFDPLTNGHVDIIERGAQIFDSIIVAILANVEKTPLFSESERITIIRDVFKATRTCRWRPSTGLLVDYAQHKKASVLVRGLRAVSDFEYEFQMALMNRHLAPGLETVFMMPDEKYTYISSRLIKEVFTLGGEIAGLVPPIVEEKLRAKQKAGRQTRDT